MDHLTHLLDTSVYSQRLRPRPLPEVTQRWKQCGDQALAISAICEAELRYGLARRNSDRLWKEYHLYLENRLILLDVSKEVSGVYGDLKAAMEANGNPRADFDLLIAATALAHKLKLASCNVRHFRDIPELEVEDWSGAND